MADIRSGGVTVGGGEFRVTLLLGAVRILLLHKSMSLTSMSLKHKSMSLKHKSMSLKYEPSEVQRCAALHQETQAGAQVLVLFLHTSMSLK